MHMERLRSGMIAKIAVFVVIAILSMTLLSNIFSSPKLYSGTIQTLDKQKGIATTLSVAVTAASTALSTLPNDTASPIADELADLSLPLFIIVCILYMEKFLLTTFGWISFAILIPLACVLKVICIINHNDKLLIYVRKIIIIVVALVLVIPISTKITVQVQNTFSETVSMAFAEIDGLSSEMNTDTEEKNNAFVRFFSELKDDMVSLVETTKNMLGILTDAIAVLLITCCVIPILTVLLLAWIVKIIFEVDIPIQSMTNTVFSARKRGHESRKEKVK